MKKLILLFSIICIITIRLKAQVANFEWVKKIGGTGSDYAYSITTDAVGNVYTAGWFRGTVDFDPNAGVFNLTALSDDAFISKLDPNGNFVWAKQLSGTTIENAYSIALDKLGNIYTTGWFYEKVDFDPGPGTYYLNSPGNGDIFVSKLDSSGNFIWAKQFGGSQYDYSRSIKLDNNGNVFITGWFLGTADFDPGTGTFNLTSSGDDDVFILKLDSLGNFLWASKLGGTLSDVAYGMAVDSVGNVYSTGWFAGTADFDPGPGSFFLTSTGNNDVFISKLDLSGNFSWAKRIGDTAVDYGYSAAVDASGNVIVTGLFAGSVDFDPNAGISKLTSNGGNDLFILKLNALGNFVWARNVGGVNSDIGRAIALDGAGNIYVTGQFQATTDFDPGSGTDSLKSAGGSDIFVLKLDASGGFLWAKKMGGSLQDIGFSISIDKSGNVYTTGHFNDIGDFDPGPGAFSMTSAGGADIFIHKMNQSLLGVNPPNNNIKINIYPNPVSGDFFFVSNLSADAIIEIYNSMGVLVCKKTAINGINKIRLKNELSGIYFLKVTMENKTSGFNKIIKL